MPRHDKPLDAAQLVCGDALVVLPTLKKKSVGCFIFSPPYTEARKQHYASVKKDDYAQWMCRVMSAIRPALRDDGVVLIIVRAHLENGMVSDHILRTRLALRNDGWIEFMESIWAKPDAPFLGSHHRLRAAFEQVLCFSKTRQPYINLTANGNYTDRIGFTGSFRFGGDENPFASKRASKFKTGQSRGSDVFTAHVSENENGIMHPAQMPVALAERLILQFTREGDVVCDPFMGSGSVLCAATITKRRGIGIEINRNYAEIAARRVKTTFTEHVSTIRHCQPVRLRTDFPDTPKSRRIYLKSRNLNASDATVFEFILSKTVNADGHIAAIEISHNQIVAATGISRSTVIRSIKRLADMKLIETLKDADWHRGRSNRVRIAASLLVPI